MTNEEFQEIENAYFDLMRKLPPEFNITDWEPKKRYEKAKWERYETMKTEKEYKYLFDK